MKWVSLHAIFCYDKSTESVMFSVNIGITNIQKYINNMWRWWNSTPIKHMYEQLKPVPFSSSSLGLGMRLGSLTTSTTSSRHHFGSLPLVFWSSVLQSSSCLLLGGEPRSAKGVWHSIPAPTEPSLPAPENGGKDGAFCLQETSPDGSGCSPKTEKARATGQLRGH